MSDIPKEMHDSMKEIADRVLDRSQESPMWRMMLSAMQDVPVLNAEIARLREENARLLSGQVAALRLVADIRAALGDNGKRMQAELIAYCTALRADAERYQWLRKHRVRGPYITDLDGCAISGDDADGDVDAARAGGGESGDAGK